MPACVLSTMGTDKSIDNILNQQFGELLFSYTDQEAISDGILIPFVTGHGDTGHRITDHAFRTLQEHYNERGYAHYTPGDYYKFFFAELSPLVGAAKHVYEKGDILKTNYDFRVVNKGDDILWYLPNECHGITMMLPSDY